RNPTPIARPVIIPKIKLFVITPNIRPIDSPKAIQMITLVFFFFAIKYVVIFIIHITFSFFLYISSFS
ncbi:hypothetical protein, partial [Aerococcus urinaeequi]|uniref:hypothetical protein n=1 Tax=Aerococcus urinaeequi TaxID=51665 RepID=UPI003D6BBA56